MDNAQHQSEWQLIKNEIFYPWRIFLVMHSVAYNAQRVQYNV